LRYDLNRLRCARRSVLAAGTVLAAFGLATVTIDSAFAEFEIQESGVEKGEVELEYRGAVHGGFPGGEREEAEEAEEEGALEEDEEGEFLRQSHDFEFEYGITERFKFSTTLGADEPLDDDFDLSSVELELQYELVEREGNGLGLAFIGAYGFATRGGEADELEFGPIMELASGGFLLTTNTFFVSQVGEHRETGGLGFEYGWRAQQKISKNWAMAAEMFGEIEDLSHAGSFDDQPHSIGPTLLFVPSDDDETDEDKKNGQRKALGPPEREISLNVGVQFGLTEVTSDTAVKFQGSIGF
jgi:hypothetical protein